MALLIPPKRQGPTREWQGTRCRLVYPEEDKTLLQWQELGHAPWDLSPNMAKSLYKQLYGIKPYKQIRSGESRVYVYRKSEISAVVDRHLWGAEPQGKPPASPDRLPLETWRAKGCVPPDVSAQEVGAAYSRSHGGRQVPRLWTAKGARKPCYSAEELLRCLAAMRVEVGE